MTLVAGIDSSTQNTKVLVRNAETGEVVREGRAPHPVGTECHPDHWWDALMKAVEQAGGLEDVSALSVGAQQHGMVALDKDGNVIRDAILWHDTGCAEQVIDLNNELGDEWVKRTGLPLSVSFTAPKVRWLKDKEPENAAKTVAICLPHDWLTWRLKGFGPGNANFDELTTDRSDASGTAYWSGDTNDYCPDLFEHAFGKMAILPKVLGPKDCAGETASGIPGIPSGLKIGVGGGDNALAALALQLEVGDAVLSLGTSGTCYARTERPVHDFTGIVSSYADATGDHLPLSCTLNAARDLDAGTKLLSVSHDELSEMALSVEPGANGMTMLPYFEGERTPNLPNATACIHGMNLANFNPNNMARAIVEGMMASQVVLIEATQALGVPIERLMVIGGAARSKAVQTILAELISLPIVLPKPAEYVAQGAAMQAVAALTGDFPTWPEDRTAVEPREQQPIIMEQHNALKKELGII